VIDLTAMDGTNESKKYADALAEFAEAQVVIYGVPFDGTSSHRVGSAQAPDAIRRESYNYETYLGNYGFDIEQVKIYDMGNSPIFSNVTELYEKLPKIIESVLKSDKFLITLGGEHSLTVPIVKTHLSLDDQLKDDLTIIYLDAHLDFRDSYLEESNSHACVARRLSDLIGAENIIEIGIRSYCSEELADAKVFNHQFFSADQVNKLGMKQILQEAQKKIGNKKLYLTIDMDVFDPAYAPGVGNPEYFGLDPWQVRECIEFFGKDLIGADIVEVSPPYDSGNTSALAAQLIQIIISQTIKPKL
jgi:agmatinase